MAITRPPTGGDLSLANGADGQSHAVAHTEITDAIEHVSLDVKTYAGAVGDGITDDSTAIQTTIDAAEGGVCYIPEGTYKVTATLEIPANTTVQGAGEGTVIRCNSTLSGVPAAFTNATYAAADGDRDSGIHIRDLFINMTGIAESGATGITLRAVLRSTVERVRILATTEDGIYLGSGSSNPVACEDVIIDGCVIDGVTRNAISIVSARRSIIRNCFCLNSVNWGIDVEPNATGIAQDLLIVGNICEGNAYQGVQLALSQASIVAGNITIEGNICRGSTDVVYGHGIHVDDETNTILGLVVRGNQTIDNANNGIYIQETAHVLVEGNTSDSNGGHGLRLHNALYCTAQGNWLRQDDPDNNALQTNDVTGCLIQGNILVCDGGNNGFRADGMVNSRVAGNLGLYVSGSSTIGFYLSEDNTGNVIEGNLAIGSWTHDLSVGSSGNGNATNHIRFNDVTTYTDSGGGASVWITAAGLDLYADSPFVLAVRGAGL